MLTAEPLDLDYKHQIIRRLHQERDQAPPSGPKCSERSGIETSSGSSRWRWYCTGSTITTASMNAARDTRGRRQVGEPLLRRAIQLPPVHASDAEAGPDLLPVHPLFRRRRTLVPVDVDASQELPLRFGGQARRPPLPPTATSTSTSPSPSNALSCKTGWAAQIECNSRVGRVRQWLGG